MFTIIWLPGHKYCYIDCQINWHKYTHTYHITHYVFSLLKYVKLHLNTMLSWFINNITDTFQKKLRNLEFMIYTKNKISTIILIKDVWNHHTSFINSGGLQLHSPQSQVPCPLQIPIDPGLLKLDILRSSIHVKHFDIHLSSKIFSIFRLESA